MYGPCANPILRDEKGDYSYAAGGSSGGSAVAVASYQCYAYDSKERKQKNFLECLLLVLWEVIRVVQCVYQPLGAIFMA